MSSDLKNNVSIGQQQGIFFNHAKKPQQPPANSSNGNHGPTNSPNTANDSFSVSQSQTINFTQQTIRQRQQSNNQTPSQSQTSQQHSQPPNQK